ncbi:hypothetical protein [Paenibacillus rhizophilus]|nr:hypothetical protein [Paenibacillus rhizophilus]
MMQFSSTYKDGVLWIDGSDPAQSSDNKITIPGYIYNLVGLSAFGAPVNAAVSLIDGFTSSGIKLSFPDNDRQKHYVEYYDSNGLANMALPNSYTYSQADYASDQKYMGASPRWKYSMAGGPRTNYPVTIVGRVAYEASVYDSGYYYDNYGWTTLATVNHQVNRQ